MAGDKYSIEFAAGEEVEADGCNSEKWFSVHGKVENERTKGKTCKGNDGEDVN